MKKRKMTAASAGANTSGYRLGYLSNLFVKIKMPVVAIGKIDTNKLNEEILCYLCGGELKENEKGRETIGYECRECGKTWTLIRYAN